MLLGGVQVGRRLERQLHVHVGVGPRAGLEVGDAELAVLPVHQVEDGDELPVKDLATAGGQGDKDFLLDGYDAPRGRLLEVRVEQGDALVDVAVLCPSGRRSAPLLPLLPGRQESISDCGGRIRPALLYRAVEPGQGLVDGVAEGQASAKVRTRPSYFICRAKAFRNKKIVAVLGELKWYLVTLLGYF